jgi:hypothetical protein
MSAARKSEGPKGRAGSRLDEYVGATSLRLAAGMAAVLCLWGPSAGGQAGPPDASGLYLADSILLAPASRHARWSPDGGRILFTVCVQYKQCEIRVADQDGGTARRLVGGRAGVWSPDGARIAYVTDKDQPAVFTMAEGREIVLPVRHHEAMESGDARWLPPGRYIMGDGWRVDLDQMTLEWSDREGRNGPAAKRDWANWAELWREADLNVGEGFCVGCAWHLTPSMWWAGPWGVWAVNSDRKYATRLLQDRIAVELSPDRTRLLFKTPRGTYLSHLKRRNPGRQVFEVALGRRDGLLPGDLLYVHPPLMNPLSKQLVGFVKDTTKGVLVVTRADSARSVVQTALDVFPPADGDVAAASPLVWARLERSTASPMSDPPPFAAQQFNYLTTNRALDSIQRLRDQPDLVSRLVNQREPNEYPGAIALGRLRLREAVPELLKRIPKSYTRFSSGHALADATIWALGEIGDPSAVPAIRTYCASLPAGKGTDPLAMSTVEQHHDVCDEALAKLGGAQPRAAAAGEGAPADADMAGTEATGSPPDGAGLSPAQVVNAAYMSANQGKYDEIAAYVHPSVRASEDAQGRLASSLEIVTRQGTIERIEILSEEIHGDSASVYWQMHFPGARLRRGRDFLVKAGRSWLLYKGAFVSP